MNTNHLYAFILCGGKGRRLWPQSTTDCPKQFVDFFGAGQSQLQETYARFRAFLPEENILLGTNEAYAALVREQLPAVPDDNILAEPIWRNTGPISAWGAYRIYERDPDAVVIIAPSDHHVIHQEAFVDDILSGATFVADNKILLTLGVTPTRPEPGYGYIQFGKHLRRNIFTVTTFIEKPNRDFAQVFINSGEFLWNTGIFLANAKHLLFWMHHCMPSIFDELDNVCHSHTLQQENDFVRRHFPRYPNIAIEQMIEQTPDVCVLQGHFGWADCGTWHSIYEYQSTVDKDSDNVVLASDVIVDNAHNNLIKVPQGHLAVVSGLNGYIVVEHGTTLLICPKEDSSALIRKYAAEVELR